MQDHLLPLAHAHKVGHGVVRIGVEHDESWGKYMGLKEEHLLRLAHANEIGFRHVGVRHGVVRVGVENDERQPG